MSHQSPLHTHPTLERFRENAFQMGYVTAMREISIIFDSEFWTMWENGNKPDEVMMHIQDVLEKSIDMYSPVKQPKQQ
jgi:hypothetical protein